MGAENLNQNYHGGGGGLWMSCLTCGNSWDANGKSKCSCPPPTWGDHVAYWVYEHYYEMKERLIEAWKVLRHGVR